MRLLRLGLETYGGDPAQALELACSVRVYGAEREAIRYLLIAERLASQHVHSAPLVRETSRALLERVRQRAGGQALRGSRERMGTGA